MDPASYINCVAAQSAQNLSHYEAYIAQDMRNSDDMQELESKFNSKCAQTKTMVQENANHIVDVVLSYFPQPWDPNYWQKRQNYQQLAEFACAHINHMDNQFDSTFSRLKNLFQRLSTWIRNKVIQVYSAVKGFFSGAVSRIRSWFSWALRHMYTLVTLDYSSTCFHCFWRLSVLLGTFRLNHIYRCPAHLV